MHVRGRNGQLSRNSAVDVNTQEEHWSGVQEKGRTGAPGKAFGGNCEGVRGAWQNMARLEKWVCCHWKTWTALLFFLFSGRPAYFHLLSK